MPVSTSNNPSPRSNIKDFLDKTAERIGNMKCGDSKLLFDELVELILRPSTESAEIEEVLAFYSASVLEMMQSSRGALAVLFVNKYRFKNYSKFHVLVSAVISIMVGDDYARYSDLWVDGVIDALICGLTAIESETISLSGSSLIKLLRWDATGRISRVLADHVDFVAILTADMCAMFSRMDESGSMAFVRIVRFCELIIDVSDKGSKLSEKIVRSITSEFIKKVYRNTLRMTRNYGGALMWCDELIKGCQRGNEVTRPLVGEVFKWIGAVDNLHSNIELVQILRNERSRSVEEIASLLFANAESTKPQCIRSDNQQGVFTVDDAGYRRALKENLNSFNNFRIPKPFKFNSLTPFGMEIMTKDREVLMNWLLYVCKVAKVEVADDEELLMLLDISSKMNEFLDL